MSEKLVADFVFRGKQQAVQITTKQNPGADCKRLDPTLLLQRFIPLAERVGLTESEYFQHELCSYLASFFGSSCTLRSSDKPEFAKATAQACNLEERSTTLPKSIRYMIDGGALQHRIPKRTMLLNP